MAVQTVISNGKNTRFWTDSWLLGQSLKQFLPHLFSAIPARARKERFMMLSQVEDGFQTLEEL